MVKRGYSDTTSHLRDFHSTSDSNRQTTVTSQNAHKGVWGPHIRYFPRVTLSRIYISGSLSILRFWVGVHQVLFGFRTLRLSGVLVGLRRNRRSLLDGNGTDCPSWRSFGGLRIFFPPVGDTLVVYLPWRRSNVTRPVLSIKPSIPKKERRGPRLLSSTLLNLIYFQPQNYSVTYPKINKLLKSSWK